ncbi:MAG: hypothetical protein QXO16_08515 [Archaeoglobaceae archaeon]
MERLFVELAGVIDEFESEFGKNLSRVAGIVVEWLKAEVSEELDREVDSNELILSLLCLVARRNVAELEDAMNSEVKRIFDTMRRIEPSRF